MRWWRDLREVTPASLQRRLLLAALVGAGTTMTAYGSMFIRNTGPIPWGPVPDLRLLLGFGAGFGAALYAAGGGAHRRSTALWTVVGVVVAFHLEEATVHWIGPFPGSITGTRVGLLGTVGSLLALLGVLLLHVEVESHRLARDVRARGATREEASGLAAGLAAAGARRALAAAALAAGLGALVLAVAPVFGDEAPGGTAVLLPAGALLLVLALVLARWVPRARAPAP